MFLIVSQDRSVELIRIRRRYWKKTILAGFCPLNPLSVIKKRCMFKSAIGKN